MKNFILLLAFLLLASSININAQWVQLQNVMSNRDVNALITSGSYIFAGPASGLFGVYISTNSGANWVLTTPPFFTVISFLVNGSNMFAGTGASGVYKSTTNGTSWTQTSLNNYQIGSLAGNANNIFAGTYGGNGVYKSTNNGTSWTYVGLNAYGIYALAARNDDIIAGTLGNGIYLSTNNGTNWTQTLQSLSVYALILGGNNEDFYAGTNQGVWKSTNYGANWTQTSLNNQLVFSLAVNGNSIFAGSSANGVFVSNDNGVSWTQRSEGLGIRSVISLCIFNNFIFAGTYTYGVWRRPLGELVGIQPISNEVPNQFSLSQNYPNPFNPTTKIRFALPKSSFAKLVVYDILGREVETIVSEQLNAGTYEADWSADKFSSGVYYYKLSAGDYTETRKMILFK